MRYNQNTEPNKIYFPTLPRKVDKVKNCTMSLTNRSENSWEFLFQEIQDIPNTFADNQDYDFSGIDGGEWQSVVVPSSLVMQGFNIENNTEYYYNPF